MLPVLALLSAVAPLATDMYLPALPEMALVFGVEASRVQLTLTAFLMGMALGQLFVGPLSDGWGRRRPLLMGTVVCFLASLACVFAPTIGALIAARFVQGVSGAAGVVLARAIIADTTQGNGLARMMGLMMMIGGIAPISAPVIGSLLLVLGGWQLIFAAISLLVAVMFVGVLVRIPETLPPCARHTGGMRSLFSSAGQVLRQRRYVGYLITCVGAYAALFGYISASSFVVQNVLGLSPQGYGLTFAANALGLVLAGALSVRLAGRVATHRILAFGLGLLWLFTAAQLLNVVSGPGRPLTMVLMWLTTTSLGLVLGNSVALALGSVPHRRGTASAFLGAFQFGVAALVSPLVGMGGTHSAWPMGVVMLVASTVAVLAFWRMARQTGK